MDSSSVLASAVHSGGAALPAVSTVYTDRTYDESDEIRSMLETTVSKWHRVAVDDPDVFDLVARMVDAHDEPVATATWLSHYVLCDQIAASGFDAVFGGLGGDELNAGEYEHFFFHFADLRRAGNQAQLAREIEHWVRYHDHPIFKKSRAVADAVMDRVTDSGRAGVCRPDAARMQRYYATVNREYYDLNQFQPRMEAPFTSYLKTRTAQDLTHETAPCCLRAEDRQTTALGLDNHVPFFDHRLIEFMFRVPGHLKIRDGVTKILLREAMRGILPEETRTRIKKTGWNAPAHVWFSGGGRDALLDLIASQAFKERGIYDVAEVRRLAEDHEQIVSSGAPRDNHMMFFWQLVNLETWCRVASRPQVSQ
jgi:asparagine synthase (glutamine-hydrolysing)